MTIKGDVNQKPWPGTSSKQFPFWLGGSSLPGDTFSYVLVFSIPWIPRATYISSCLSSGSDFSLKPPFLVLSHQLGRKTAELCPQRSAGCPSSGFRHLFFFNIISYLES